MLKTTRTWFTGMSEFSKAIRFVGIIIAITMSATLLLASFKNIPEQVRAHETRIQALEKGQHDSTIKLDRIICMLSQPDTLKPLQVERICR